MFTQMRSRFKHTPLPYLVVLLFAIVVSGILCGLQADNEKELENYEKTYRSIPVYFSVTNLSASMSDNLEIPAWLSEVFTPDSRVRPRLWDYASEVDMKLAIDGMMDSMGSASYHVFGVNSLRMFKTMQAEGGANIQWVDGYDESVLENSKEFFCLVPEGFPVKKSRTSGMDEFDLRFTWKDPVTEEFYETTKTFQVMGTYKGDATQVFAPIQAVKRIYPLIHRDRTIQAIRCKLTDNDLLPELRETSKAWFAEPNPLGEKTEWGKNGYPYYPFALEIDDTLLQTAKKSMETSIMVNKVSTVVVFGLSVCAGFLVGFLMVRSRKKEIALLRTLGTPNGSIYLTFVLEQMLCILAGAFLGGLLFRWQPVNQLGLFAAVYFIGLTLALMIFLSKNLMTSLKEEE